MPTKSLFPLVLSLFLAATLASNYKTNPNTQFFIDQYGRSVLFHGVNAVYKLPPYYPPVLDSFDPSLSLSAQDFQNLRQWGLNSIRLYISWEGTEQIRGQYNYTYLSIVRDIVRAAAQYNISVLLDAHQDLGSRKFCGEGMPDWAVNRTNFPYPLTDKISYDAEGHANLTDCLKVPFFHFLVAEDLRNAFYSLYTNVDGIADNFANFWQAVATYFKDEPNVIGYELINEPPASGLLELGNIENQDGSLLQPFYAKINQKIREVDNETIVLFEPTVTNLVSVGFTEGPGGPEYNDRQAFAYHQYCGIVDSEGAPQSDLVCKAMDTVEIKMKSDGAEKIKLAALMTEFGAVPDNEGGLYEINTITDIADDHIHGWMYWQFKYYNDFTTADQPPTVESFYDTNGNLYTGKVKALARSYAYATCGVPTSQQFDSSTGEFSFSFKNGGDCEGKGTEFFLSEEFYYANGFSVSFNGCDGCELVQLGDESNYYGLSVPASVAVGAVVTVEVKTN